MRKEFKIMITRIEVVTALRNIGISAEVHDVKKNGVVLEGIIIKPKTNETISISPVIYMNDIISDSLTESINNILRVLENSKSTMPNYKSEVTNILDDKELFLSKITIAIKKKSNDDIVKLDTDFDGIEKYLLIKDIVCDGQFSIMVTNDMLKHLEIPVEIVWKKAEENLEAQSDVKSMQDILGFSVELDNMIVTTKDSCKGASAILLKSTLEKISKKYGMLDVAMIPSSVHEIIIMSLLNGDDISELSKIVRSVNEECVKPEDILSDRAYLIRHNLEII